MRKMAGIHNRPLTVEEDTLLMGIVNGPIRVLGGVHLVLRGIVNGDVVLEPGATAELAGLVNGRVERRVAHPADELSGAALPAR